MRPLVGVPFSPFSGLAVFFRWRVSNARAYCPVAVTLQLTAKVMLLFAGKVGNKTPLLKNVVEPEGAGVPSSIPAGQPAPPVSAAHVTDVQLSPADTESLTRLLLAGQAPVLLNVTV